MTESFVVDKGERGVTLHAYLKGKLLGKCSAKAIKRAIDHKLCKVNGEVEWFSTRKLSPGDVIRIDLVLPAIPKLAAPIYEDEEYLIVNKPPGMVTESFAPLLLVHRLDKDTSGLLILAKTREAQEAMNPLFADRGVKKEYLAIVDGEVEKESWTVDNYLEKKASFSGGGIWGIASKGQGKRAITEFTLLEKGSEASLILARPITGRTHQIRIHLQGSLHPVLGDGIYGRRVTCSYVPKRHLLHAWKISFVHPLKKKELALEAPLSPDFIEAKKVLFTAK